MFRHRPRYVHQTKHHRLRNLLWAGFKSTVADVDGIDIWNSPRFRLEGGDLHLQSFAAIFIFALVEFDIKLFDRLGARPAQGNPARHRDPHGTRYRDIGRRPRHRVTRTSDRLMLSRRETPLG